MKSKITVKHYGFAGHFILGPWCRFHMATEVGDYLISSVGFCVPPSAGGSEKEESEWVKRNPDGLTIGAGRSDFYETVVFRTTGDRCEDPTCRCGIPMIDGVEQASRRYSSAGDAQTGHEEIVETWIEMCERGIK